MTPCDTGPLVSLVVRNDPHHARCLATIKRLGTGPLLTTWPCLAEAMYLVHRVGGYPAQADLWQLRAAGRLLIHVPEAFELDRIATLMGKYRDLPMDLADASLVVAAESLGLRSVFTLDRHFHAYRLADGSALHVVP